MFRYVEILGFIIIYWYHAFLLSLLYPLHAQGYILKSNTEAGLGRIDMILHAPVGNQIN